MHTSFSTQIANITSFPHMNTYFYFVLEGLFPTHKHLGFVPVANGDL